MFQALSQSQEPFYCIYCSNIKLQKLQQTIQALEEEVHSLKSKLASDCFPISTQSPKSFATVVQSTTSTNSSTTTGTSVVNGSDVTRSHKQRFDPVNQIPSRKFNLVVYGVKEKPKGTLRHTRLLEDTNDVAAIISKIDPSVPDLSIQDCTRLGKYMDGKCRPILVKMSRSCEVSSILSQRYKLKCCPDCPRGVSIKPDMSPDERKVDKLLMGKRWELLEAGISRDKIKIRGNSIYVCNKKVGSVINLEYKSLQEVPFSSSNSIPSDTLPSQVPSSCDSDSVPMETNSSQETPLFDSVTVSRSTETHSN